MSVHSSCAHLSFLAPLEIAPWDASLGSPIAIIHRVPVTTTLFEPLIALNDDVGDARTCPSPTNTCQRKMMGNNMSRTPHCNLSNLRSPTAGKYLCGFTLPIGHVNDFPRVQKFHKTTSYKSLHVSLNRTCPSVVQMSSKPLMTLHNFNCGTRLAPNQTPEPWKEATLTRGSR